MPLHLLVGPVRSGKLGAVLDLFGQLIADGRQPVLLVPALPEREALEREVCERSGALIGGEVLTLDDLAQRIGKLEPDPHAAVRCRLVRRRVAASSPGTRPAALLSALEVLDGEVEGGRVERSAVARAAATGELSTTLGDAHARYLAVLGEMSIEPPGAALPRATARLGAELAAWSGRPVVAYGFDDLSAGQIAFFKALAARCALTLALPYEPGRPAFAALSGCIETLLPAAESVSERRAGSGYGAPGSLVALAHGLFAERDPTLVGEPDGGVRLLEAVGGDGEARAVVGAVSSMLQVGVPSARIVVVAPSSGARAARIAAALEAASIPASFDRMQALGETSFGGALVALLRYAWQDGEREQLFRWLRSPAAGVARVFVDECEARLRLRAEQREREVLALVQAEPKGKRLVDLDTLRAAEDPRVAVRVVLEACASRAFGLDARVSGDVADVRAWDAAIAVIDGLAGLAAAPDRDELVAALERTRVALSGARRAGAIEIVELGRARLRAAQAVIVTGLEDGGIPRRPRPPATVAGELRQASQEERDRYLFCALVARTDRQLVLVRRISDESGRVLAPSPFWLEVERVLSVAAPPAELVRELAGEPADAITPRERLRAIAGLAGSDPERFAGLLAGATTSERARLTQARSAWRRPTAITHPELLERHAERTFSATELESFAKCSARWFVEREIRPKPIDGGIDSDARQRGIIGHDVLKHFFKGMPAVIGKERLEPGDLPDVRGLLHECIERSIEANLRGSDPGSLGWVLLRRALERDLWGLVERESERTDDFDVRSYEVSIPEPGLDLGGVLMRGRIDRIDRQSWMAYAIVRDYKTSAPPALGAGIVAKGFLQIPLYITAVRELLGYEAVGGVYQPLRGGGEPRGMLRLDARDEGLSGFSDHDYLADDIFEQVLDEAVGAARSAARRIRRGDVRHDPSDGTLGACPSWCPHGSICRVEAS